MPQWFRRRARAADRITPRAVVCRDCGLLYEEAHGAGRPLPEAWGTCPRCGSGERQYASELGHDAGRDDEQMAGPGAQV